MKTFPRSSLVDLIMRLRRERHNPISTRKLEVLLYREIDKLLLIVKNRYSYYRIDDDQLSSIRNDVFLGVKRRLVDADTLINKNTKEEKEIDKIDPAIIFRYVEQSILNRLTKSERVSENEEFLSLVRKISAALSDLEEWRLQDSSMGYGHVRDVRLLAWNDDDVLKLKRINTTRTKTRWPQREIGLLVKRVLRLSEGRLTREDVTELVVDITGISPISFFDEIDVEKYEDPSLEMSQLPPDIKITIEETAQWLKKRIGQLGSKYTRIFCLHYGKGLGPMEIVRSNKDLAQSTVYDHLGPNGKLLPVIEYAVRSLPLKFMKAETAYLLFLTNKLLCGSEPVEEPDEVR